MTSRLRNPPASWFSQPPRRKTRAGVERHPNRLEEPGPSAGDGTMGERDSDVEGKGKGTFTARTLGASGKPGKTLPISRRHAELDHPALAEECERLLRNHS